jgi:hypothetical protein
VSETKDDTTADRESQYTEVSLRAVELLARAQRTADEAVAEAQAYARDLEASARAQYAQILQRAQVAAREMVASRSAESDVEGEPSTHTGSVAIVEQVDYVRTYARVAHAQLKTVLTALTDELDHLAEVAAGTSELDLTGPAVAPAMEASWPSPPDRVPAVVPADQGAEPQPSLGSWDAPGEASDDGDTGSAAFDDATARNADGAGPWGAEFTDTDSRPTSWRNSFLHRS